MIVAKMAVSSKSLKEDAKKHCRNVSAILPPNDKPSVIAKMNSPEAQRSPSACAKKKAKPKVAFGTTVAKQQRSPSPVESENKENSMMEACNMTQKLSPTALKKQTRSRNPTEVQACQTSPFSAANMSRQASKKSFLFNATQKLSDQPPPSLKKTVRKL